MYDGRADGQDSRCARRPEVEAGCACLKLESEFTQWHVDGYEEVALMG